MPSPDRRLNPDLERALPADSDEDPPGYRRDGRLCFVRFGDGTWHEVTVRAWWRDRCGRRVMKIEWRIEGAAFGEAYLFDSQNVRPG